MSGEFGRPMEDELLHGNPRYDQGDPDVRPEREVPSDSEDDGPNPRKE
jgi:hypothetical protein